MSDSENRRESFRIDDEMKLHVNPLDPTRLDAILEDFEAFRLQFCLKSHFLVQKEIRLPNLLLIRKRDPDIAQYLEHLENQMLLLAERMNGGAENSVAATQAPAIVNLSSNGLRFHTAEPLALGQVVELGMLLSTSGTQIIMLATVVRLEDGTEEHEGLVKVSLNFSHINADDTEAIIRHMVKLQQIQLQERRAS